MRAIILSVCLSSTVAMAAEPVTEPIDLLAGRSLEDYPAFLNPKFSQTDDPAEAFVFTEDGQLHVTGKGWGYLRTKQAYRDYHMIVEFKWGEHTYGARADNARDCGVFVHVGETDQIIGKSWPRSIEVQLLQSTSGNLAFLGHRGAAWSTHRKSGERFKVMNSRFPESFEDVKGFQISDPVEQPMGAWNRLEVIADGENLTILLNGQPVNNATALSSVDGRIGVQSELAECWIRRWELHKAGDGPLETWAPDSASTDTGYSPDGESILPREFPLSPGDSLAAWEIDGDYELQLVAAEPLVCDPVDVAWDAAGRMFVAEMGDYPFPPEGGNLSRIRLLTDTDGDGTMDKAVTWLDDLDHVQGLLPLRDGLLATTRTAILFLRDTDGDDRADEITTLFESNAPNHNQLQIASPRWGLDHAIYLNNGLDGKEIYPDGDPESKLSFSGKNLRYDPRSSALTTTVGRGQFGATFDDWGRRYFCSNRNPVMMEVLPLAALDRNPHARLTQGHADIANGGGIVPVYPLQLSHTTANAHAGTHTAACGMAVFEEDMWVCEPTGQLIVRYDLVPDGGAMKAVRQGEGRDFLASHDEWSRPVNLRPGPDGALYICDMYRRFIDHARFFPEDFSASHYMRAGVDQGRIYRLVEKGTPTRAIEPLPEEMSALVAELESPHVWRRMHAQRTLIETRADVVPDLEKLLENGTDLGKLHAFHTLASLGKLQPVHITSALNDDFSGLVESAILHTTDRAALLDQLKHGGNRIALLAALQLHDDDSSEVTEAFASALFLSDDPWLRRAILSSSAEGDRMTVGLMSLMQTQDPKALSGYAQAVARRGDRDHLTQVTQMLERDRNIDPTGWKMALVTGLLEGGLPPDFSSPAIDQITTAASQTLIDPEAPIGTRMTAVALARRQGQEAFLKIALPILTSPSAPELQTQICGALAKFKRDEIAEFFFAHWDELAPTSKREAVGLIGGRPDKAIAMLEKMKAGEIDPNLADSMARWRFSRSTNETQKTLAIDLFGTTNEDRAAVLAEYRAELDAAPGDPAKGREIFQAAACFTCHQKDGLGMAVGPNLADVKIKPAEALLTDILDPNRAVEGRWAAYIIETTEGQTVSGLITTETAQTVELVLPGGAKMSLARADIASLDTTGHSLMPVGLEGAISKEAMRDLIAFLKQ